METIKEEKKADLEQLLNSLIEKGWKPRGHKAKSVEAFSNYMNINFDDVSEECTVAEIVRKSSGLWQFVCENRMIKEEHKHERILDPTFGEGWADCKRQEHDGNYGYRLIESSLKDESELEDFLLSNIKVDE